MMARFQIARNAGGGFVLLMLAILVVLVVLVFSIRKHAGTHPNAGPPPNQHLRH
jgi:hypothetical protein